jgi:hypothetical protein
MAPNFGVFSCYVEMGAGDGVGVNGLNADMPATAESDTEHEEDMTEAAIAGAATKDATIRLMLAARITLLQQLCSSRHPPA